MTTKKTAKSAPERVVVRNLDELEKGIPREGKLMIHLTREQWTNLTKGLPAMRAEPKVGIVFRFTPLPDGAIGQPECMPDICENCSIRWGRGLDGTIGIQCRCRLDPACIDLPGQPPPPPSPRCRFVIDRQRG